MKKVLAFAIAALTAATLGAQPVNAFEAQPLSAVNKLPGVLPFDTYLTLEQPGRTKIDERLDHFFAMTSNIYIDEPILATIDMQWSRGGFSVDETLVDCRLEFGVGLASSRLFETTPKKILGSMPVTFEWQEVKFGDPFFSRFDWRLSGTGVIPGPTATERGDFSKLVFRIFCGETLVFTNNWTLKGIVGKPTIIDQPSLKLDGDSAIVSYGTWAGLANLDLVSYSWFACDRNTKDSNCEQIGKDTVKYAYQLRETEEFSLNESLQGKFLALLVSAANSHGASSAWTEFLEYGRSTSGSTTGLNRAVIQRTLATFSGSETNLSVQQKAQVKAAVDSAPDATKFICTGIRYFDQPMSVNIMVRKRAKAACDYAKQLNPNLSTWFQNKPTQARSYAGKVLLTIKNSN